MRSARWFRNDTQNAVSRRNRALVICAHLRRERIKSRSSHFLQPISGLHIASLIDEKKFDITLYHEDWHGPFDTLNDSERFDIVFVTGLQADFDRMRQLSYHFQRNGAAVVAGGSICTLFPEFAAQFFTSVCAGGVDAVRNVILDFENRSLRPIYRSTSTDISSYDLRYRLFSDAGIRPLSHLIEASRGCNFRCSFCVIPAEGAKHTNYDIDVVRRTIDNALQSSPFLSFRRWYPTIYFLDNNFADNKEKALAIADLLRSDKRIRAWGALVTQDILQNRNLIQRLFHSKCRMLFVGLESLDRDFLKKYNKKQNLSRKSDIIEDVLFAEKLGICVGYGYLFDPRSMTAAEMRAQLTSLAATPGFPMPTFLSLISPLAGTAAFWEDAQKGELAPNLLLRDLDGETVAYSRLTDEREALTEFVEKMSRMPWTLVNRGSVFRSMLKRLWNSGQINPIHWYVIISGSLYPYALGREIKSPRVSYFAGEDALDPQYREHPSDISKSDWQKYFKPITITGSDGKLSDWLLSYAPKNAKDYAAGNA